MYYYGARYYDPRISIFVSVDPLAEKYPNYGGYIYTLNNPINIVDIKGRDIIFLFDSKAVASFGHAAVLIGNDRDGWRYLSMNGTGEGSSPMGRSKNADLGNIKGQNDFRGTGLKSHDVIAKVNNSNPREKHNYDKFIHVATSSYEDALAYEAARSQANNTDYSIFGSSCVDVPQEAFSAVVNYRINKESEKDYYFWPKNLGFVKSNVFGFDVLAPNDWYKGLLGKSLFNNYFKSINSSIEDKFEYKEIHASPRDN